MSAMTRRGSFAAEFAAALAADERQSGGDAPAEPAKKRAPQSAGPAPAKARPTAGAGPAAKMPLEPVAVPAQARPRPQHPRRITVDLSEAQWQALRAWRTVDAPGLPAMLRGLVEVARTRPDVASEAQQRASTA